jgi:hypothetical protein
MNSEHMHVKYKYVVIVVWNILQEFKFHLYQKKRKKKEVGLRVGEGGW